MQPPIVRAQAALQRWAAGGDVPGFFIQLDAPSAIRSFSTRITATGEIFEGEIGRPLVPLGTAARDEMAALARAFAFADLSSLPPPEGNVPSLALHIGLESGAPFALWIPLPVFDATPWLRSIAYAIARIAERALAAASLPGKAGA